MTTSAVPSVRIAVKNAHPIRAEGSYVLYWTISARRTSWNFGLERAVELCNELARPLVVLEPLRCGYEWASERLHSFVVDGMLDQLRAFQSSGVTYLPFLERRPDEGKGLISSLATRACAVITDEFPSFFLPRMIDAAAAQLRVRMECVDSNGIMPLRSTERLYPTAALFRRHVQATLPHQLTAFPDKTPLTRLKPLPAPDLDDVRERWNFENERSLGGPRHSLLRSIEIPRTPSAVEERGGSVAASQKLQRWLSSGLPRYGEDRSRFDVDVASGLSAHLHFGHISAHEIVARVLEVEKFVPWSQPPKVTGARAGFWGLSSTAESFLDELITWREVGYNFAHLRPSEYDKFDSLPEWAKTSLAIHASDPRPVVYSHEELESAQTHDALWNAAQTQLVRDGKMQNYVRMLWGKKILEWSPSPEAALQTLIELNNRYALDGRNPNSYSGIFWTLGRYDRPWGPERPIFGTIRYMSSDNTARKFNVKPYLAQFSTLTQGSLL